MTSYGMEHESHPTQASHTASRSVTQDGCGRIEVVIEGSCVCEMKREGRERDRGRGWGGIEVGVGAVADDGDARVT